MRQDRSGRKRQVLLEPENGPGPGQGGGRGRGYRQSTRVESMELMGNRGGTGWVAGG